MANPRAAGPERQTLDEILDWHQGVVEALVAQRAAMLGAPRKGSIVPPRFVGMMVSELEAYYDYQRKELNRVTVFNLVASVEATKRVDYARRVDDKLKDPLAKAHRKWDKSLSRRKHNRTDFDERGILDVVKSEHWMRCTLIGEFRECLRSRHWVGHGRYWPMPVEVDRLDPIGVYDRCLSLLQAWPA